MVFFAVVVGFRQEDKDLRVEESHCIPLLIHINRAHCAIIEILVIIY